MLFVATFVALFWLIFFASTAHANDCIEYVKHPTNFLGIPKALIEDCMRTGNVQAIVTGIIAILTGGTIVGAVNTAIKSSSAAPGESNTTETATTPDGKPLDGPGSLATIPDDSDDGEGGGGDDSGTGGGTDGETTPSMPPYTDDEKPGELWGTCPKCRRRYFIDPAERGEPGMCPFCQADVSGEPEPLPGREPNGELWGTCPKCFRRYFIDPAERGEPGMCPYCQGDVSGEPDPKPDEPKPGELWGTCGHCHHRYFIDPAERGEPGLCPFCQHDVSGEPDPPRRGEEPPGELWGTCPKCSRRYFIDPAERGEPGMCPYCQADVTGEPDPPLKPKSDSSTDDTASTKPTDEAPMKSDGPDKPTDGPAEIVMTCPICGTDIPKGATKCPGCRAFVSLPDPVTPPLDPAITTPTGASSTTAPATPPVDPPMTHQGIISGDKAIDLLEQSGLAKVTRDADGKVIKVEEAFPFAFTNLGGQTVTMQTGETTGGRAGDNFVETVKGQITGIAFKTNPDGSVGDPVVVLNHSDPSMNQRPGTPEEYANQLVQDVKDKTQEVQQQAHDAISQAEKDYEALKKKVEMGDVARNMYKIGKFVSSPAEAEAELRDYAIKNGYDPEEVIQVATMNQYLWDAVKAGIKIPDTLRGK
jgi:hypothetical protein